MTNSNNTNNTNNSNETAAKLEKLINRIRPEDFAGDYARFSIGEGYAIGTAGGLAVVAPVVSGGPASDALSEVMEALPPVFYGADESTAMTRWMEAAETVPEYEHAKAYVYTGDMTGNSVQVDGVSVNPRLLVALLGLNRKAYVADCGAALRFSAAVNLGELYLVTVYLFPARAASFRPVPVYLSDEEAATGEPVPLAKQTEPPVILEHNSVPVGYHNIEQFRQCPRQARDKFMVLKAAGKLVPGRETWKGDSPRLALKALSHAGETLSGKGAVEWYDAHTTTPDQAIRRRLGIIGNSIGLRLKSIEAGLSGSGWHRLVEASVDAWLPKDRPEYIEPVGAKSYELTARPDVAWWNFDTHEAVLVEIKGSSNPFSREWYATKSDQLLFYSQVFKEAGLNPIACYMILAPSPVDPAALSGALPTSTMWISDTEHPGLTVSENNKKTWAALYRMLSATYEEQAEWPAHSGGWCPYCDTRLTCPLLNQ